jgi:AAA15 family ATPase/GTPase
MLTSIHIKNFKRFDDVKFELGSRVVFIGPNNSGKTTALQALALWEIGLRKWREKRPSKSASWRPYQPQ